MDDEFEYGIRFAGVSYPYNMCSRDHAERFGRTSQYEVARRTAQGEWESFNPENVQL